MLTSTWHLKERPTLPLCTLQAESPSIFLDKLSRKIEGDSARRVPPVLFDVHFTRPLWLISNFS